MGKRWYIVSILAVALGVFVACGGNEKPATTQTTADLLPEQFESLKIIRSSDVRFFEGEKLYEHINGGAEVYHLYDFVDVATAYYKHGETEIVLDIFKFAAADGAYGLLATLRPWEPEMVSLGAEGFVTESTLDFVKGQYLVRLTGYDESEATSSAIRAMGPAIEKLMPGTSSKPPAFDLFPKENAVANSEKIYAEAFMSRQFLNWVYSRQYAFGEDTATLFLTDDASGAKIVAWGAAQELNPTEGSGDLPFSEGASLSFESSYYGQIVCGLAKGRLVGIVGYKEPMNELLGQWLQALP